MNDNRFRLMVLFLVGLALACGGGAEGQDPQQTRPQITPIESDGSDLLPMTPDSDPDGQNPLEDSDGAAVIDGPEQASDSDENVGGPMASVEYLPDDKACVRPVPLGLGGGGGQDPQFIARSPAVLLRLEDFERPVQKAIFSPDGQIIVTLTHGRLAIWDGTTGEFLADIRDEEGFFSPVFTPDSRYLSAILGIDEVITWDLSDGRVVDRLPAVDYEAEYGPGGISVDHVTYSPDGQLMATSQGRTAWIWDVKSGERIQQLEGEVFSTSDDINEPPAEIGWGHSAAISDLSFSPDGRVLLTSGGDGTVRMWETASGRHLRCYEESPGLSLLASASISPDGLMVMSHRNEAVTVWDAQTGEVTQLIDQEDDLGSDLVFRSARFGPTGQRILTGVEDGTARVWDLDSGELTALLRHPDVVNWADYSPDGRRIITGMGQGEDTAQDPYFGAWIWDAGHDDLTLAAGAQKMAHEGVQMALDGDIEEAIEQLVDAQAVNPNPDFDLEAQGRKQGAYWLEERFEPLIRGGELEAAAEALGDAMTLNPSFEIENSHWNEFCRYGSLWGRAEEVLTACDRAVYYGESDYDAVEYHDSRGIARALVGDYDGAIEDFEYYIIFYESTAWREEDVVLRRAWVADLESGRNPFDEATLRALRNE
jgi:WD40 repeat protein